MKKLKAYLYFGGIFLSAMGAIYYFSLINNNQAEITDEDCIKPMNLQVDTTATGDGWIITWEDPVQGPPERYRISYERQNNPGSYVFVENVFPANGSIQSPYTALLTESSPGSPTPGQYYRIHVSYVGDSFPCGLNALPTTNGVNDGWQPFPGADCELPSNLLDTPSERSIELNWTPPSSLDYINHYEVWVEQNLEANVHKDSTTFTITSLTPGETYDIELCIECDLPNEDPTRVCLNAKSSTTIGCPTPNTATVSFSNISPTGFTVNWPSANLQTETYRVYYSQEGVDDYSNYDDETNNTSTTFSGLSAGTSYQVKVCSTCGAPGDTTNCTNWKLVSTIAGCEPPINAVASDIRETQFNLSWDPPAQNQYLQSYRIYSNSILAQTLGSNITNHTLNGLNENTSYAIQICSYCDVPGQGTTESCVDLGTISTSACPAPSSITHSSITSSSYRVSWPTAGLQTETYRAYHRLPNNPGSTISKDDVNSPFAVTFDGLDAETTYETRICATCGDFSSQDNCTAWQQVTTLAEPGVCDPPNNAIVEAGADQNSCPGDPVTLTASPSNGQSPYTYIWSSGDATISTTVSPIETSTYYVTMTDNNGCEAVDSLVVNMLTIPSLSFSTSAADCGGTGSASVSISGGSGTYSYQWETGSTFASSGNVSVGTYNLTVTDDATGCVVIDSTSVDGDPAVLVNAGEDQWICFEETSTTLSAIPSGGTGPFTYEWNVFGDNTQQVITVSPPNFGKTYSVTITDANGCTATDEVEVNKYSQTIVNVSETPTSCGLNNGALSVSPLGGEGPYAIHWSTGSLNSSIANLGPGTYAVSVTDKNGCTYVETASVAGSTGVTADLGTDLNICAGQLVTLDPSATGDGNLNYNWSTGETTSSIDVNPTNSILYSVTVTDQNGCTATDQINVTVFSSPDIQLSKSDASCGEDNGTITTQINGGTPPFLTTWNNGASTTNLANLGAGTYTLTLIDANGCTAQAWISLNATAAASLALGSDVSICSGESHTINPIAGGNGAINYSWSTGATSSSLTVNPVATTAYQLTITDADGCQASDTITIVVHDLPTLDFTAVNASCGENNGSITANPAGGTAPYIYNWSNGAGNVDQLTDLAQGTYTLTLTDDNGCSIIQSTTLSNNTGATVDAGSDQTICVGESIAISAPGTGLAPYNYTWSGPNISGSGATVTVSPTSTATYSVTLTADNGCTATDEVTINVEAPPVVDLGADIILCEGESTILDASTSGASSYNWSTGATSSSINVTPTADSTYSVTITGSNGCEASDEIYVEVSTVPSFTFTPTNESCGQQNGDIAVNIAAGSYSYAWSNGSTSQNISSIAAGTYTVTITNAEGCTATGTTSINNQNEADIELGNDTTICAGASIDLSPQINAGTGPYTYSWEGGETSATVTVSPSVPTTYYLTVTDNGGCTAEDSIHIDINEVPVVNIGPDQSICPGTIVTLGGNPVGPDGATYLWSIGSTGTIGAGESGQITLSPESSTTFSLAVTGTNGCSATDLVTVTVTDGLQLSTQAIQGSCTDTLGSAYVQVNGGLSPYTYQWSNGTTNDTITDVVTGTYTVTVSSADGCSETASVQVEIGSGLQLSFVPTAESTNGAADGSATVQVSGGVPPYSYQWDYNNATTASISNLPSNIYQVTVTDSGGCSSSGSVTIIVADGSDGNPLCGAFSVEATVTEAACSNEGKGTISLATSNAQTPIHYQWSTGDTTASIDELEAGTYHYTVVDATGCSTIDSAQIQPHSLVFTPVDSTICQIVDYVQAIPMDNNEILFVVEGLSQSAFDNMTQSSSLGAVNITVNYQGELGPRTESLNLFQAGTSTDIGTWSMIVYDALYETNILVSVQLQQDGSCPVYCENTALRYVEAVQDSVEAVIEENPPIELVGYECGDAYTPTTADGTAPLALASPSDLFYIQDFPILITQVSGSSGNFSGQGIIPLPFNKQTVKVIFDNVSVNSNYQIYAGEVVAVADTLSNYNFMPDTVVIGGEICLPPPPVPGYNSDGIDEVTGLDDWGFDANGIHNETGTGFDPNGFDANGIHEETGTEYNPEGCNREGRNEQNEVCDPRAVSEVVQGFIDSVSTSLPADLGNALSDLIQEEQDKLSLQAVECNAYRSTLDSLLNVLGYDRKFIFGPNDEYYNKGMHQQFESAPDSMVLQMERDPNTVALERKHIQLFHCDEAEVLLEALLDGLNGLQNGDQQSLQDFIVDQMKNLEDAEASQLLSDPVAYMNWLADQIEAYLAAATSEDIGYLESPIFNEYASPKMRFNQYGALAANGEIDLGGLSEREQIVRELDFQFQQGFKYIDGVHRAFFLEELAKVQTEVFNEVGKNLLPIKVSKYIGGYQYTILLDRIIFTPTGAILDAFLILEDPENTGQRLVFEALNVGFGPAGMNAGSSLVLVSETEIRLSNNAKLILKGGGTNYVDWDCTGFLGMHVDAQIEFCRNHITPLDPITLDPLPEEERYRLDLETYVFEWLDIIVGVDAQPFALTGLEDIKWEMDSMYIDLSDKATPLIIPPDGYSSPHFTEQGLSPLWRGFYMKELSATLPNEFSTSETLTVGVEDVLIDGCGFSGDVFVENLVSIGEGSAGGWPFSIDKFGLKVLHNRLAGADFGGLINVPVFEGNMGYEAVMYPGNHYRFTIQPNTKDTMNLFLAEATIHENSKVEMEHKDGEFIAVATLSGQLKFTMPDTAAFDLELPELRFCNFKVSNKDPYFDAGVWELVDTTNSLGFSMAGFEMDISNIQPYKGSTSKEAGLGFNVLVSLGDDLVTAGGSFGIMGELEEINYRQKWKFKKLEVNQFFIDADIKNTVSIVGVVNFFEDHPTFGKGFHGLLDAEFKKGLNFRAQAAGQFGKINDYDYFFVDVLVESEGLGLAAGPISIKGFGGGVSYRMDNNYTGGSINFGQGGSQSLPPIGVSFSGVQYTPDETIGLGLKATALIATGSEKLFNGSVSLEMLFNAGDYGGGLREISLKGNGHFLAVMDVSKLPVFNRAADILDLEAPPREAPLTGYIDLSYNFNDRIFSGDLAMFMNAGGIIRGAGDNYSLCWANIYFGPEDWYINIGTPDNPCGMIIDVPGIGGLSATAYLDVGTKIPDFPGLPDKVRSLASKVRSNEGLRKSGGGFMFGAAINVAADFKFGPAQGYLDAGLGFDIMLRDYGNAVCLESGQGVGINGWYAAGQMWGYLEGGVKLFGVPILEAGLAAVLQTRLPNPFWAQATLGVKVKVLFIKKKFNVAVKIGELCTITSDDPSDVIGMNLVTFTNPVDGALDNATDTQPEAYFAVPMDSNFEIPDEQGNPANFKARVRSFTIQSANWGTVLPSHFEYFNDRTAIRMIPGDLLPGNDSLIVTVKIEIQKNGEFFAEEEEVFGFTTGEDFDHIPSSNIANSYPLDGMYEFYRQEYNREEGYIQLTSGQPDLLLNLEEGVENKLRLEASDGSVTYQDIEYVSKNRRIKFALPLSELVPQQLYKAQIVNVVEGEEKSISDPIHFRVSEYAKFRDKIEAVRAAPSIAGNKSVGGVPIAKNLSAVEYFDDISLYGTDKVEPLADFKANLGNNWYRFEIRPLIYNSFPLSAPACGNIAYAEVGSITDNPREAAGINRSTGPAVLVGADHFAAGAAEFQFDYHNLRYNVPGMAINHYRSLRSQVSSCVQLLVDENVDFAPGPDGITVEDYIQSLIPDAVWRIYDQDFPNAPHGTYQVDAIYRLPDGTQTSIYQIDIQTIPTGN